MPFLPFYSFIPEILGKFAHTLYKISYFFFYLCSYIIKYKNLMDKITIYLLEEKQAKRKGAYIWKW